MIDTGEFIKGILLRWRWRIEIQEGFRFEGFAVGKRCLGRGSVIQTLEMIQA